jgi:hypothetical protein
VREQTPVSSGFQAAHQLELPPLLAEDRRRPESSCWNDLFDDSKYLCDDHAHRTARAAMNPHWLVASGSDRLEKKAAVVEQGLLIRDVSGAL